MRKDFLFLISALIVFLLSFAFIFYFMPHVSWFDLDALLFVALVLLFGFFDLPHFVVRCFCFLFLLLLFCFISLLSRPGVL